MPGTTGSFRSVASSPTLVVDPAPAAAVPAPAASVPAVAGPAVAGPAVAGPAVAGPAVAGPDRAGREAAKRAMRARIRAERRSRTPARRQADAEGLTAVLLELPEVALARCVAVYASVGGEPGTDDLRAALRRLGVLVLLPVVLPDAVLDWAVDDGDLRPTPGPGGPEPAGPRLGPRGLCRADVILAPALAVDTLGHRLGQGGGYYDRALSLVDASVPVLALVHDTEVLDAAVEPVPVDPHDHPVDAAVTPSRYLRLARRRR